MRSKCEKCDSDSWYHGKDKSLCRDHFTSWQFEMIQDQLKEAGKVIAFYADIKNWGYENNDICEVENDSELVKYEDLENIDCSYENDGIFEDYINGKKAREYQEKYNK